MKTLLVLCLFLLVSCLVSVADGTDENSFLLAKRHLQKGEFKEAIPILEKLYIKDSTNLNVSYLLGLCHTQAPYIDVKAVRLLKKATKVVSKEYNPASFHEIASPVYVWYYLSMAYGQHGQCDEAYDCFTKFVQQTGKDKDDYFVRDLSVNLSKCVSKRREEEARSLAEAEPEIAFSVVKKHQEYSTPFPIYSVQVGAYQKFVPAVKFRKLNNVEAFQDKEGTIRYVVGHFGTKSLAEQLLKAVKDSGYVDAFIVDVNKEKRFEEEVIIVNHKSLKAKPDRDIEFSIQVGAFRDSIPKNLLQQYMKMDGIRMAFDEEFTFLCAGSFVEYKEAMAEKRRIQESYFPDAFVIALERGSKISVEEAKKYYEGYFERK